MNSDNRRRVAMGLKPLLEDADGFTVTIDDIRREIAEVADLPALHAENYTSWLFRLKFLLAEYDKLRAAHSWCGAGRFDAGGS